MVTKVQKWGNSLAVRIPLVIAKDAQLCSGAVVNLSSHDGKIIIIPARQQRYKLADLLKDVTPCNLHGEIPSGDAVGKEAW